MILAAIDPIFFPVRNHFEDDPVPIYEYQCDACGHQLEALQKISDDPLKTCPECHRDSLRKRVSAAAFRLKGSGWYETDFKNKQKPVSKGKEGESASGNGGDTKSGSGDGKDSSNKADTKTGSTGKDSSSTAA